MDPLTLLAVCTLGAAPAPKDMDFCTGLVGKGHIERVNSARGASPGPALALDRWQPFIAEAAQRFGIPEAWIRAVMRAESAGEPLLNGTPITSRAGAMGLMQVMPQTYAAMRFRYGLGPDPYAPRDNILAGTAYLLEMYVRYGYPGLFAAYNAGPESFGAYELEGRSLPSETLGYLAAISPNLAHVMVAGGSTSVLPRLRSLASAPLSNAEIDAGTGLFFDLGNLRFEPNPRSIGPSSTAISRTIFIVNMAGSKAGASRPTSGLLVPLGRTP